MSAFNGADLSLAAAGQRWRRSRARLWLRIAGRRTEAILASSLTRRIVLLNLGGLFVLAIGFFLFNQFRADIIDAREASLRTQAAIIAAAIAASAGADGNQILIEDPDKILSDPPPPSGPDDDAYQFSVDPERVGPMLHRLVTPTKTRARIYDQDGALLVDSGSLTFRPPADEPSSGDGAIAKFYDWAKAALWPRRKVNNDDMWTVNGKTTPEIAVALTGQTSSAIRANRYGETIVSVATPIRRGSNVRGALQLFTQGDDIDAIIASERWGLIRFFLVLTAVMLLLSLSLANTIAGPVRRLAEAAERVRRGIRSRQQIPDFTDRPDEIGHLSGAMREMTQALYNRLDAIESFAADVAHELKNPLTSLRSAMETLPRVSAPASRDRLLAVMQHDVRRLDRLISDISDASRLDAELSRHEGQPLDLAALARAVVSAAEDSASGADVRVTLSVQKPPPGSPKGAFRVGGHDSRLAQVLTNLIDNARSFSSPGDEVKVVLCRKARRDEDGRILTMVELVVEDDGPGISPQALERIFERFYTDRPAQHFGNNSGLGLSISRQIVEAHGGRLWAENRSALPEPVEREDGSMRYAAGAQFTVSLPALEP